MGRGNKLLFTSWQGHENIKIIYKSIDIGYLLFFFPCKATFYYGKYQTVCRIADTFNSVTCNQVHRLYFACICTSERSMNYNDFTALSFVFILLYIYATVFLRHQYRSRRKPYTYKIFVCIYKEEE